MSQSTQSKSIYVCGPTVYDHSHLGHARTYIMADMINRTLTNISGFNTHFVMNITDIDDKIIRKATESGGTWIDIAKIYEQSFFDSMAKLNVALPDVIIRVSDVIPQIISYIQKIISNGFAYVTSDGSVYFDSQEYIRQGYIFDHSSNTIDDEEIEYKSDLPESIAIQKKSKRDFALWKGRDQSDVGIEATFIYQSNLIQSWGRPGWHIECSAMIHETIGQTLDLHLGGCDLEFPHHHNERLQAHAYYHPLFNKDNTWVDEFMHIGHLCIVVEDDQKKLVQQKMSKSLKNFTTIDDALNVKQMDTNQIRWLFATHNWRDTMDFSDGTVSHAKIYDDVITNFLKRVTNYPFHRTHNTYIEKDHTMAKKFNECKLAIISSLQSLRFDIMAVQLKELISQVHCYISVDYPNEALVRKISTWIFSMLDDIGFTYNKSTNSNSLDVVIMNALINARSSLRTLTRDKSMPKEIKQKIFEILDRQRDVDLPTIGLTLCDTKDSSLWFKK